MKPVICFIDDEQELVQNLALEVGDIRPDWEVHAFSDGFSALQLIMSGKVNVLVTDIAMPDMDGYELYWRVKDYDKDIAVIMMTGFGYDPNHVLVRSKVDGLKDVIFKPFDVNKLIGIIDAKLK